MLRRQFLKGTLAAALTAPLLRAAAKAGPRPNFLFIVGDDIGWGDLSCFGSRDIRTPNLDRLAAEGLRFTDFHANAAVCTPTRAAFFTGRYQHRSGLTEVLYENKPADKEKGLDPRREWCLGRAMKEQGYATGLMGKWHLGERPEFGPLRHGFDEFRGYKSGNIDYVSHLDSAGHPDWWNGEALEPEEGYSTDLITRHSVDFIRRHAAHPFLLVLTHECVHGPLQAPGDPPQRLTGEKPKRSKGSPAQYKAMMESMDKGIGETMKALGDAGIADRTFVFFFSDNGAHEESGGSNGPWRGAKASMYEGGHRTPAIAWYPGRIPVGISTETVMGMDLMPTALAMAGIPAPQDRRFDGVDLSAVFAQTGHVPTRDLCWNSLGFEAIRRGKWKLVRPKKNEHESELFNLELDPGEKQNLSAEQPELKASLLQSLSAWREEVKIGATAQPLVFP